MTILNVPVTGGEVFAAIALIFVSPVVTGIIGKYKLNKSFIGGYSFGLVASIVGMAIGFVICKLLPNSFFLQAIETNGKQGTTPITLMFAVGIILYLGGFAFYCKKCW